jgi:hypothetical protein
MVRPILLVAMLAAGWPNHVAIAAYRSTPPVKEDKKGMDRDIEVIDAYLAKWDRFAKGENALLPDLKSDRPACDDALGRSLKAKDKRAPARLVFSAVVQVAGGIPVNSALGREASALLGPDFPVLEVKAGKVYFAGDLYFWWLEHKADYEPFPLFDEWSKREFAQKKVIPMYSRTRENQRKRGSK